LGNISNCGAGDKATVIGKDYKFAVEEISKEKEKPVFDVVIMDPPYEKTDYYGTAMKMLIEKGLLDEGSIVVCEHLYDNKLLESYNGLQKIKEKKYGSIGVDIYQL
jgi:16S rRNA G966 N2-methylase RsmD